MTRISVLSSLVVCWITAGTASDDPHIGYFWHMTDPHYDHTYDNGKLSCNSNITGKLPGYGDYWCDSTWRLVTESIQAMASIKQNVDFLIWTGDNVAHISDDLLSLQVNLQVLQNITDAIRISFNEIPVYASLGNHDFYPNGQASPSASPGDFYTQMTEMWRDWIINQSNAIDQSTKGGYYAVKVSPKFAWMEDQLLEAKSNGEKVILTGHVPPGLLHIPEYVEWYWPQFKTRFMSIILNYSDIITALHFGHDHYDSFKILQSDDGTKAVPQFCAPSVTPWRHKLQEGGVEKVGEPHNPGLRLIKYNRTSGAQLDYSQYYINITMANAAQDTVAVWKILYNFTSTYGVNDMSIESLRQIFTKLEDNNSPLYQKFCNNWVVSDSDKTCTNPMRANILCGGQKYKLDQAKQCSQDRLKMLNASPFLSGRTTLALLPLILAFIHSIE
ncbi:Acid sphingomyelinase-like phosphodiesterase 3b [Bulinus truncatus]|nr:Acid sphingomyelinase-like phosphodiesterase 3b [Bulinus truncatus]